MMFSEFFGVLTASFNDWAALIWLCGALTGAGIRQALIYRAERLRLEAVNR